MQLNEFIRLLSVEEAMIELVVDVDGEDEYQYKTFWYSDFIHLDDFLKEYRKYKVDGFSFIPEMNPKANLSITVRQTE